MESYERAQLTVIVFADKDIVTASDLSYDLSEYEIDLIPTPAGPGPLNGTR